MTDDEFREFGKDFLKDQPWILKTDGGYNDKGEYRCIRVRNVGTGERLLVSSEGPHISLTLREVAQKAGTKKQMTCHILRHSFASTLVKKKVGLVEIQKLLGHSNLTVTSIYTHTNMDALSEAVNTLN